MVTPCFVIPIKNIGHCGDTHSITYVLLVLWLEMNKVNAIFKEKKCLFNNFWHVSLMFFRKKLNLYYLHQIQMRQTQWLHNEKLKK